jgi:hypothetical protein
MKSNIGHERVFDWFFFKRHRIPRWLAIEKEKAGDREATTN